MTEPLSDADGSTASAPPRSAGAMLKAARERAGLHLAVLAATIKVAPAKLQALEQDRYDELPNLTFARALAQAVCRSLKIDPRPVLGLLPQVETPPLEGAVGKLNTPFQDRPSRADGAGLTWASKPMFWAGGLLLLAALVVGMLPSDWFDGVSSSTTEVLLAASAPQPALDPLAVAASAAAPAVPASVAVAAAAASAAPLVVTAPADPAASATSVSVATAAAPASMPAPMPAAAGLLGLHATADSWIEVIDAQDRIVFSRVLRAGESVGVDGRPPLRVSVGNAGATSVTFRGQPFELGPYTRVNVARFELR